MQRYLGRKQTSSNADWLYAADHIESLISADEVEAYAADAVGNICTAADGKHAAFAWSGGKDSIVLADLCAQAGVTEGYMAYCDLDYPAFVQWCREHKPAGVTMMHTGYGLDWLAQNQELIFAQGKLGQRWHLISQRRPFTRMFLDKHLDILIVGHRIIDGNVCGADGYIRKRSGEVRFAPWQTGRMKSFWGTFTITAYSFLPSIPGKMDTCREPMHGRNVNSVTLWMKDTARFTISTIPSYWRQRRRSLLQRLS